MIERSSSPATTDCSGFERAIAAIAVPGILVGHRVITGGDEGALLDAEFPAFANSVTKVQRASGAARIVARGLLRQLDFSRPPYGPGQPIVKSASGVPIWPPGIVGSLAHDSKIAVAAVGLASQYSSVGIDVEPASAVADDLLDIIATRAERAEIRDDLLLAHVLFTIKEAVYKAVYPREGMFLEHHDVEVKLADAAAIVSNRSRIAFTYCIAEHILALAYIPSIR